MLAVNPLWHDLRSYVKAQGDTSISFKILKEQILVQKQTVPHLKAPLLGFFETERISQKKFFKHEGDKSIPPPVPNKEYAEYIGHFLL